MKQRLYAWLCIGAITAVIAHPLLGDPLLGDDLYLHYFRIPVISSLWQNGVFYSRWSPDLLFGYGFVLFNFYPPLSAYLLTALYWLGGQNGHLALGLFYFLILLLSTSGMYMAARRLYGDVGGVLSAAAYGWSPYLLLQPYSRASIANGLALSLVPWAVWGMLVLLERRNGRFVTLTALFITAIFLSHVVSSVFFIAPFTFFGVTAALLTQTERKGRLLWACGAIGLGVGLAAFFWLPAFGEIGVTRYAFEASQVDYRDAFAHVWRWPPQGVSGIVGTELPKSVGLVQQALGLVVLGGTAVFITQNRKKWTSAEGQIAILTLLAALIGLSGLFLATAVSDPIWQLLTPLQGLQFPWRLLGIATFWLALSAGWLGQWVAKGGWRLGLTAVLLTIMLANAVPYLHPPRTGILPKQPSMADASAVQQERAIYGLLGWGEYAAAEVSEWPTGVPFAGADQFAPLAEKLVDPPEGLTAVSSTPWQLTLTSNSPDPMLQPLYVHTFPGWQLTIDGEPVPLEILDGGTLALPIPAGERSIELWFGSTMLRQVGTAVSLVALLGLFAVSLFSRKQATDNRQQITDNANGSPFTIQKKKQSTINNQQSTVNKKYSLTNSQFTIHNSQFTISTLQFLVFTTSILLVIKLLFINNFNTPLMLQPDESGVPTVSAPPQGDFGVARLIGAEVAPPDQLVLYWQGSGAAPEAYEVVVTLRDGRGFPVKELFNQNPGSMRMTRWEAGQIYRDAYTLPVDVVDAPVLYQIDVALAQPESDSRLPILDGADGQTAVFVGDLKKRPSNVADSSEPIANFNENILLKTAVLPEAAADGEVDIKLTWGLINPVPLDYTLFIHLLDEEGNIIDQNDAQPTGGVYPTSAWEVGDVVSDTHSWTTDAPAGNYTVQIGFYDLETGLRLPVSGDGALGDRIVLGKLTVNSQQSTAND